jgi:hypothetical protein
MKSSPVNVVALVSVGSLLLICSTGAQTRTQTQTRTTTSSTTTTNVQSVERRYGVQAYDGRFLHPDGRQSTAVPVNLEDGRTGELVIPSGNADRNVYYRDDQTGDFHPVRMDRRVTRQQLLQGPRAVRFQPEPQQRNRPSWQQEDALIIGGGAAAGALIGAAAGGENGAVAGAVAGGVGGLIYDLLTSKNKR